MLEANTGARSRASISARVAVALGALASAATAAAQITTDGTLGAARALAGPNFEIPADLGRQAGANLFHSFARFGVPTGGSATFRGPGSVANIISRVTGAEASTIDGRLASAIPGANLFLINPRGIVFGPNASLDLSGSFHASTAHYLRLADGTRFDTSASSAPVLTSAPPAAFGFLGPTGSITVQGSGLRLAAGQSLSLVGGAIDVRNAVLRLHAGDLRLEGIRAGESSIGADSLPAAGVSAGDVAISASEVGDAGDVGRAPGRLVIRGGRIALADTVAWSENRSATEAGPIELRASGPLTLQGARILASAVGTGRGASIALGGADVSLAGGTAVQSWSESRAQAGDIAVSAADTLNLVAAPGDRAYTNVLNLALGAGAGGATALAGDSIAVDGAIVQHYAAGSGDAGPLALRGRSIELRGGAYVNTHAGQRATGRGGDIAVDATERFALGGVGWNGYPAELSSYTAGGGDAGSIRIGAPEISVVGGLLHNTTYGAGDAGALRLDAATVRLRGGNGSHTAVDSWTQGSGNGGPIDIRAATAFEIDRGDRPHEWTRLATTAFASGQGGHIRIESPSLTIRGDQAIWSGTFADGRGGDLRLHARDVSIRDNGTVNSIVATGAIGRGGDIVLEGSGRLFFAGYTAPLSLGLFSATDGPGRGGDIRVSMPVIESALEPGARIQAATFGPGDAGDVDIATTRLALRGGGIEGSAFNFSSGNAGNLRVVASEAIELTGRPDYFWGGLYSRGQGTGRAGSITLAAPRIVLDDNRVQVTGYGEASGGRIEVRTNELVLRNGGQIDARTLDGSIGDSGSIDIVAAGGFDVSGISPVDGSFSGVSTQTGGSGSGGRIRIEAGALMLDRGFVKSTATGSGHAGDIGIQARTVQLANGGRIDASTAAGGNGGNIDVFAVESIIVSGMDRGAIVATLPAPDAGADGINDRGRPQGALPSTITTSNAGAGAGGRIGLNAPRVEVRDGGIISASSTGTGSAGSIAIAAGDALLVHGGTISTQAVAADGGDIDIRAGNRVHLRDAEISTSVGSGQGAGGNIFIDPIFVILENSRIVANAFGGPGGNIRIIAQYLLSTPGSLIDASSRLGTSGSVQIAALNTNLDSELAALPTQVLDASAMLRDACTPRLATGNGGSSLVGVGRGGLAASPERFAASSYFAAGDALASNADPAPAPLGLKLVTTQRARLLAACAA